MTRGTYGRKLTELFALYDQGSSYWKTSQATFPWVSDKFSETWPRAGMTRGGIAFRLPPLVPLTDVTASSSWPTPDANIATRGTSPNWKPTRPSGQPAQYSLNQAAADRQRWPTPTVSDAYTDKLRSTQQKEGSMHSVTLAQAVQRWPTPRAQNGEPRNHTAYLRPHGPQNLENAVAVRDPSTIGGKLNPTWVEWLMGFPTGWTDLGGSETR
jgi:hypothetical protein